MRILVCASDAPLPPLNGMRLQLRALCAELARRHAVCVLAYRWPELEGVPPEGVELLTIPGTPPTRGDRLRALVRREPVDARLAAPMAAVVERLRAQRSFDVAHVMLGELAGVAPALEGIPALLAPLDHWPLNVAAQAAAEHGAAALWRRLQLRATERFVATRYAAYRRVVFVTDEDAGHAGPSVRAAVIPNGVDAEHFSPGGERDPQMVLFTGVLSTPANEQAAEALVRDVRVPGARIVLAGRTPSPRVRALGAELVADAPDLRPLLRRAAVYACPMETGTGIKNKLLEAMACGAACVATPLAAQGVGGEHLLVAEPGVRFGEAVARLLRDPALRERLGTAARAYVLERHSWAAVAAAYEALYADIRAEG
jgi:glycosyltransferase involved in cell wall biosynthesis